MIVAIVKNYVDNFWRHFNDDTVSSPFANLNRFLEDFHGDPYILFYKSKGQLQDTNILDLNILEDRTSK